MDQVHFSSETPEHYTPESIIGAVCDVFEIDLDPCADPGHRIPARLHYTANDDGLAQRWYGRVYMNPPYGRGIGPWVRKLAEELHTWNHFWRYGRAIPAVHPGRRRRPR